VGRVMSLAWARGSAILQAAAVGRVGRDFRIGLICGLVLVVVALIWVATRPSLSSQARMLGPRTASSRDDFLPSRSLGRRQPRETLPPGLIPAEPDTSRAASPTPVEPAPNPIQSRPPVESRPSTPDLTVYEQQEKILTTKFHIVRKDETLSSISQQYYGTANKWQKILEANRNRIKDPNKITPGAKLIIPD